MWVTLEHSLEHSCTLGGTFTLIAANDSCHTNVWLGSAAPAVNLPTKMLIHNSRANSEDHCPI